MSHTPPVRMCIGCRKRAAKSDLLRVVAETGATPQWTAVPDFRARRPGRGASLHPTIACLDLAERRRAFPRALKLEGPLDISALRQWISTHEHQSHTSPEV